VTKEHHDIEIQRGCLSMRHASGQKRQLSSKAADGPPTSATRDPSAMPSLCGSSTVPGSARAESIALTTYRSIAQVVESTDGLDERLKRSPGNPAYPT